MTKKPTCCKSQLYMAVNSIFAAVSTRHRQGDLLKQLSLK